MSTASSLSFKTSLLGAGRAGKEGVLSKALGTHWFIHSSCSWKGSELRWGCKKL